MYLEVQLRFPDNSSQNIFVGRKLLYLEANVYGGTTCKFGIFKSWALGGKSHLDSQ